MVATVTMPRLLHIGAGAVSAATGTDAKQPRVTVTKIILKMIFIFFSLW